MKYNKGDHLDEANMLEETFAYYESGGVEGAVMSEDNAEALLSIEGLQKEIAHTHPGSSKLLDTFDREVLGF
jgi:hypothetical protein